jgi:dUTP pyrophosphatase
MLKLRVKKCDPDAVIPTKAHPSDTGYDLTLIRVSKDMSRSGQTIIMFDTGIAVCPPDGYYTEVVPRSSLSKTGYMLANSVGIIDSSYRGSIKVVLTGDETLHYLSPPFKGFQLILRKLEEAEVEVVDDLDQTERGDGGFGSTN